MCTNQHVKCIYRIFTYSQARWIGYHLNTKCVGGGGGEEGGGERGRWGGRRREGDGEGEEGRERERGRGREGFLTTADDRGVIAGTKVIGIRQGTVDQLSLITNTLHSL